MASISTADCRKTSDAFLWTQVFNVPLWSFYGLLAFILYKHLHATPIEITLFIASKPAVSLLSVYWSALVHKRPERLVTNIVWAGLLGRLPFLLFPFVQNIWYIIFASALYMTLVRGVVPAWMEVLKLQLPDEVRNRTFAFGSIISYSGSIVIGLGFGTAMDLYPEAWPYAFACAALVGMGSILFQLRIPLQRGVLQLARPDKAMLTHPWKEMGKLLKSHPDFMRFQLGFMLGGFGLIVMQPVMPVFFTETLALSYTEIAAAIGLCKGIGYAITSPLWARALPRMGIFKLSALVCLLATLFPLALVLGTHSLAWVFIAYLGYGIMQGGSELSWHLSGPIFARDKDSSSFSAVNVSMVGLRGMIAPFLGTAIAYLTNPTTALVSGSIYCLCGALVMIASKERR